MAVIQYVALLRGINVGGKNIIKMADLKASLDAAGFDNVITYIQSGNVLFESATKNPQEIVEKISKTLHKEFNYGAPIVLRSHKQMKAVVAKAPHGFGNEPTKYRYDVIFLKEPLSAASAIKNITMREGVDTSATGPGALYFSRLISKAAQSYLSRIISLPIYQSMTIRNWNTTTKLLAMMDDRAK